MVSAWGLEGTPPPQGAVTAPPPVTISLASHSRLITDTQLTLTDTKRRLTDRAARNHATVLPPAARSSTRGSRGATDGGAFMNGSFTVTVKPEFPLNL